MTERTLKGEPGIVVDEGVLCFSEKRPMPGCVVMKQVCGPSSCIRLPCKSHLCHGTFMYQNANSDILVSMPQQTWESGPRNGTTQVPKRPRISAIRDFTALCTSLPTTFFTVETFCLEETGERNTTRDFTIDEPSAYLKNVLERGSEFRL